MNKQEMIRKLYESGEFATKSAAERAFNLVLSTMKGALTAPGDRVRLPGLGTLEVKHRKAYLGRNPHTGEPMQIKARNAVRFRASSKLLR